jgi:hypothetical protein
MSDRAWLSAAFFGPPSWGIVFAPVWAVAQGGMLLTRDIPVAGMAIAHALCGF